MKKTWKDRLLMCKVLALISFSLAINKQVDGQCIANTSPTSANQGETGFSVTITLGASAPAGETPYLVRLDSLIGTDVERDGTTLTATFSIPSYEATGSKTLILEFPSQVCTSPAAFTVNANSFSGTVYYVDPASPGTPPYSGTSWATAFTNINMALNEVSMAGGGEIWIKKGTYTPNASDRTKSFGLKSGVYLYGGFDGTETARSQRDYVNDSTILSGDIGTQGDSTDNSYHVLLGANDALLDGFYITGGQSDGELSSRLGGGMYNYNVSPSINNCVFYNNFAEEGGAIYNIQEAAISVVSNSTFINNNAYKGGAIATRVGAHTYIDGCTFSNNHAAWRGGAIFIDYGADPVIINTTINNNTCSDGNGGAIYIDNISSQLNSTAPTFKDVSFSNNSATYRGGAISIYNNSTDPVVYDCSFTNNSCGVGGGAIAVDSGPKVVVKNATNSSNSGGTGGNNIDNNGGQITNY
ncbi:MAG: hypothetical protein GY810_02330 [Aureispira sp.]|nr:hypothetical protein [Aureispira sp.]